MDDYEQFWTASRLTRLTQRQLTERLAEHRSPAGILDPFTLPSEYHPLSRPTDLSRRWYLNRRSDRSFSSRPMTARTLGAVLDTLSATPDGRRAHPSAGGLNPLRCYPVLLNVRHPLNGHITRYDPDRHALQAVGPAPRWPELAPIALRLSRHRLAGYLLGGAVDADVLALIGLLDHPVRLAAVVVCGHRA